MRDADCIELLQWALPRLEMRWGGFRKVRRQVCRRIAGRMRELGIAEVAGYRRYLESTPAEWRTLDPVGRKGVRPPWCRVEVPGPDAGNPLVQGWVNGRFLMPISDQTPDCS